MNFQVVVFCAVTPVITWQDSKVVEDSAPETLEPYHITEECLKLQGQDLQQADFYLCTLYYKLLLVSNSN